MFDRIAPRYDLLNRLLSFGRDVAWRKQVSRYLPNRPELAVLDLATGTGDLLISLYKESGRVTSGVGMDLAEKMLELARKKIAAKNLDNILSVALGDAKQIPSAENSFDVVTIAFGIRNVDPVEKALSEMYRILKPGGRALILEFSLPENFLMRRLYLLYFRYVLPAVGAVISGDSYAYRYLNRTVETFPYGEDFCRLMKLAGFNDVKAHRLTFGVATIYEGSRE
jgi:demethylmenaquinone methyltransferase/2-methoxy-6-polyprenyl-1,4-benzoquinol methylase